MSVFTAFQVWCFQGRFLHPISENVQLQGQLYLFQFLFIVYRDSQDRGAGVINNACPSSHPDLWEFLDYEFCYPNCRSGYTGKGKERLKLKHTDSFFNDWSSDDQKVQI